MDLELDFDFAAEFSAEKFFFGVANAPHLSEGGYNSPDGTKNSYAVLELSDRIQRSGESTRFWTDYEEHIALAASLGLDAFRMGIDWARVQPSTSLEKTDPPPWSDEAVDHYARMVEEINDKLLAWVGRPMTRFILSDEINLVPLIHHWGELFPVEQKGPEAIRSAYDNMLARYVTVYEGLHDVFVRKGWGTPEVGFDVASLFAYELDEFMYDIVRLRQLGVEPANADRDLADRKRAWMQRIATLAKSKLTDGLGDPAGEIYAYLMRALRSGDKQLIAGASTRRCGEGPKF